MNDTSALLEELLTLIEDYDDFNPGEVQSAVSLPSAVAFSKQVSKGLPCVYPADQVLSRHAARKWDAQYLIDSVRDDIEVAVTPDGQADSICAVVGSDGTERAFLQPANVNMSMKSLLSTLTDPHERDVPPVHYLQSQNSNLTTTNLQVLLNDLPSNIDFAKEVLGTPEAMNIWIGDQNSVTSTHRDPYENLYIVLRGSKTFTLWPPVNEVCMDVEMVRTGRYTYDEATRNFEVQMDENEEDPTILSQIPWVPIDPRLPREELNKKHHLYRHAKPRFVTVQAGEMLYLPSGWYHHVTQRCGTWDDGSIAPCIAVNYWYDMDYDGEKHVTRQLVGRLTELIRQQKAMHDHH